MSSDHQYSQLSERGRSFLSSPPKMVQNSLRAQNNRYHPETNPDGLIDLTTAQNATVWREIKDRLTLEAPHVPKSAFHYDNMTGVSVFREAIAHTIFGSTAFHKEVDPNDLVIFSGSGSLLDTLATVLTDPGDRVLIPAPYYGGFDLDFQSRAKAKNITVMMQGEAGNELSMEQMEKFYDAQEQKPKILVITNPMNPQSTVMSKSVLQQCVDFAKERKMELIFDEIYANSVWGDSAEFISSLHLDRSGWEDHIHLIYGFSKDFGLDGFRIGILHTKSQALKDACQSVAYFASVSGYVQHVLARAIGDVEWTQHILHLSKQRLREAHDRLLHHLQSVSVPDGKSPVYSVSEACNFGWFYLGGFLPTETLSAEQDMLDEFLREGVVVGAGHLFQCERYGWFRISLSAHDDDVLTEAYQRIVRVLKRQVEKMENDGQSQ